MPKLKLYNGSHWVDIAENGKSAYELWIDSGNKGTQQEFLKSLKGKDGKDGKSPVVGKDFMTDEEVKKMIEDLDNRIRPELTSIFRKGAGVATKTYSLSELEGMLDATTGQVPTKQADGSWAPATPAGAGDMLAATYDPNTVSGDAFLMTNMNGTAHRLFYTDASGDVTELAHGTSGQVLQSNGATSAPSWASAGSGDMLAANNLSDLANAATARTNLGVDAAGTDNSTDVTLTGTGTYLSITGQAITVDPITESDISDLGAYITGITGEPLSDLSDVTITTIASGELLKWNGTAWINNTLAEAGIQPAPTEGAFANGDKTKLDGIETGADVTDTTNVTAAGALMDSEVDADIKTLSLPANTTITAAAATVLDDATVAAMVDTLGGATATGTGGLVRATSPTLAGTPVLPSTFTIGANNFVRSGAHALTLTTTATTNVTLPTTGTLVTQTGTSTLSNKTLTAPKFASGGFIADNNGNEQIKFTTTASAVNEITVTNAATGNAPAITATGGDTNIDLNLGGKGSGDVKFTTEVDMNGQFIGDATEFDNGNSSTADTIDWGNGNFHKSTLTANCTYTFTAPPLKGRMQLKVVQDATGSRTVTWPATVKWPGGTAPTLSTAASAIDIITFYWDGTSYYGVDSLNFS